MWMPPSWPHRQAQNRLNLISQQSE